MQNRIYAPLSCILLLIFLMSVTFSSPAHSLVCRDVFGGHSTVEEIFKASYSDKEIYHSLGCAGNVGRLLQRFSTVEDISQMKVLVLLHEKGYLSGIPSKIKLSPANARDGMKTWNYHVIILSQDHVIDLHSRSVPIPVKEYFNLHFPENKENKRWERLILQVFPATPYLSSFVEFNQSNPTSVDQVLGRAYLNKPASPDSPILSLSEFLQNN